MSIYTYYYITLRQFVNNLNLMSLGKRQTLNSFQASLIPWNPVSSLYVKIYIQSYLFLKRYIHSYLFKGY